MHCFLSKWFCVFVFVDSFICVKRCGHVCVCVAAEIPEFLSEEECGVVVRLAQLKGLMESQVMVPEGQEELNQQLNLSPEEIFNFLDLNQDGQLQPHEVCWQLSMFVEPWFCSLAMLRKCNVSIYLVFISVCVCSFTLCVICKLTAIFSGVDIDTLSSERWNLVNF